MLSSDKPANEFIERWLLDTSNTNNLETECERERERERNLRYIYIYFFCKLTNLFTPRGEKIKFSERLDPSVPLYSA